MNNLRQSSDRGPGVFHATIDEHERVFDFEFDHSGRDQESLPWDGEEGQELETSPTPRSVLPGSQTLWDALHPRLGRSGFTSHGRNSFITPQWAFDQFQIRMARNFDSSVAAVNSTFKLLGNLAVDNAATQLILDLEQEFVTNAQVSSLDLLNNSEGVYYRHFPWRNNDFPGNGGKNQDLAEVMAGEMTIIRPERRPNSGKFQVFSERQFCAHRTAVWNACGTKTRLFPEAHESFVKMRDAATILGVELKIHASRREAECINGKVIRKAADGNRKGKATFSSHMLGLAVDLDLIPSNTKIKKTATNPFQRLVAMRSTPAHKFMFARGALYGWYPYKHEPWHWEYNPEGLVNRYQKHFG